MPRLDWPTKNISFPAPGKLALNRLVFPQGVGYLDSLALGDWAPECRLIRGDNLAVMATLLPEFEGKIQLIYADPPFFTNRAYPARVGRGEDSRKPQEWQLAEGYPDHWDSLDDYLDMLYPRLALMHRLLAPAGTLYLHLDWHADAYARLLLDEIFGADRLLNEIIWLYHGPSPIRRAFNRKHDTILAYTKSAAYTFNVDAVRQPYDPNTVKTFHASPKAGFGKIPDLARGKVPEDWWYFPVVARLHNERTGYPTQKPAGLLERILLASSNPGDLAADFFCGSGTLPGVAERLGRSWLASDVSERAIHTTASRLVEEGKRPFGVWRLDEEEQQTLQGQPTGQGQRTFAFRCQAGVIECPPELLPVLDYWEVDPLWDGRVFRSAVQAARPRRKQPIASRLELPVLIQDIPACVHYVTIDGEEHFSSNIQHG